MPKPVFTRKTQFFKQKVEKTAVPTTSTPSPTVQSPMRTATLAKRTDSSMIARLVSANPLFVTSDVAKDMIEKSEQERKARLESYERQKGRQKRCLWLPEGGEKNVYIREATPLYICLHHNVFTMNSKIPEEIPCTSKVTGHCAMCDAGHRSAIFALFEVIDLDGYTSKQGQRVVNYPMWFIASDSRAKVLVAALQPFVRNGSLNNVTFRVSRIGTGTQTTYIWSVQDMAYDPPAEVKHLPSLFDEATTQWSAYDEAEVEKIAADWQERATNSKGQISGY